MSHQRTCPICCNKIWPMVTVYGSIFDDSYKIVIKDTCECQPAKLEESFHSFYDLNEVMGLVQIMKKG